MIDLFVKICVIMSGIVSFCTFIYLLILFIKLCVKRISYKKASKNEKLRIEKEKEIAYKLYLEAKSKEVK